MKRTAVLLLAIAFLCASFGGSPTHAAADTGQGWYVKRNKEHKQPSLDESMKYIEKYDAFYIDSSHAENTSEKVLYLTFDAGFENGNVEKILDILREEKATGAFFVLAHLIKSQPALIKRMVADGHLVCNHSVHHKDMSKLDEVDFDVELLELERIYEEYVGGSLSKYFRPPEGRFNEKCLQNAQKNGYKTVFWSMAYADWDDKKAPSPERAKELLMTYTHNGAILLLHPTSNINVKILRDMICYWREQGYRFGSLEELTK